MSDFPTFDEYMAKPFDERLSTARELGALHRSAIESAFQKYVQAVFCGDWKTPICGIEYGDRLLNPDAMLAMGRRRGFMAFTFNNRGQRNDCVVEVLPETLRLS